MHDKEWLAVDRSDNSYKDNLYASMTYISLAGFTQQNELILYKKPAQQNEFLKDSVPITNTNFDMVQFTSIDVDNNGYIHVAFFGQRNSINSLYNAISTDGGNSFTPETKISDFILPGSRLVGTSDGSAPVGIDSSRLYPCPQLAIDKSNKPTTGNLYVVWSSNGTTTLLNNGLDVYFSRSTDKGQSWSQPVIVNDDEKGFRNEQYYPSISVNENGVICIGWYDRRDDRINNVNTNYYMAFSFDGGQTFTKNFKITSTPTDFSTVFDINQTFGIGEYNTMLSTKGYAIPVWSDGRTNDGDLNVYTAFVQISPVTSVESITPINSNFTLFDVVPNPAINDAEFSFELRAHFNVKLLITDLEGKTCRVLYKGELEAGKYSFRQELNNLTNGAYFCRLETNFGYAVKKFIVNK